VLPYDFADPEVVEVGGAYYGYATNGGGGNVQLIRSADLVRWEWLGDALPALPAWAAPHRTWAPAVLTRGGTSLLYYAVHERASGRQCISVAVAARPEGPFLDGSSRPFVCQHGRGGSIDPSTFVDDDGRAYLLWKSEDETVGGRATLWSAPLTADGRRLAGPAQALLRADRAWEHRTVEGPAMVREDGTYHLVYSGSSWAGPDYGVGHARCAGPLGPCRRSADGPFLRSFDDAVGAGGAEVLRDAGGRTWLVFHAWTAPHVGFPNRRTLRLAALDFPGGLPRLSPR
jgi:beta-xylosidase